MHFKKGAGFANNKPSALPVRCGARRAGGSGAGCVWGARRVVRVCRSGSGVGGRWRWSPAVLRRVVVVVLLLGLLVRLVLVSEEADESGEVADGDALWEERDAGLVGATELRGGRLFEV